MVVPSLPGFGFSQRIGLTDDEIVHRWEISMNDLLGYEQYFTAGGEVGSGVTKSLARLYPEQVAAIPELYHRC